MLDEFKAFCERNSDKVIYDILKYGMVGSALLFITALGIPFFILIGEAQWWLAALLGLAALVFAYLAFRVMKFLFTTTPKPSVTRLKIAAVPANVWPHALLGSEGFRNFDLELEIHNEGALTAYDISAEIVEMDTNPMKLDTGHFSFPAELSFPSWHDRTLNPGDRMKLLFMSEPRVVTGFERAVIVGVIAGQGGFMLKTDTDFEVSIRLSARDFVAPLYRFTLRFVNEGDGYEFTLTPVAG